MGLSDDDDDQDIFSTCDDTKLMDVLSDQAEFDSDSCNMSLASEQSVTESACSIASLEVEFEDDTQMDRADVISVQRQEVHIMSNSDLWRPSLPACRVPNALCLPPLHPSLPLMKRKLENPHYVKERERESSLASKLPAEDLAVLGLIPRPVSGKTPAYPAHLPFVRCCYDANQKKGCGKGNKCYHIHADPEHRCKPDSTQQGRHQEVYVDRPHFISFDTTGHPDAQTLPCHYGMQCKSAQHRECATKHKFNAVALAEYEAYLRSYRSYEFELIKYQLAVNKARRDLPDSDVFDALARCNETELSLGTRSLLVSLLY